MDVIADTASVILLFKAELLLHFLQIYQVKITPGVYVEITGNDYPGAKDIKKLVHSQNNFNIEQLQQNSLTKEMLGKLSSLDLGEKETIMAYLNGTAQFILIDDRKGAKFCHKHQLPFINALLCPKILYFSGEISQKSYLEKLQVLQELGRYSQRVKTYVKNCKLNDLNFFMTNQS